MELWFTMVKYGTMEKPIGLWKKLGYYTENSGTLIYYGKNYDIMEKKYGTIVNYSLLFN